MPIDASTITVDSEAGTAAMSFSDLEIPDYFTVPNSLMGGGPDPVAATISVDITWSGELDRYSLSNEEQRYAGDFVDNTATLSWSAANPDGFTYEADAFDGGYAVVGSMRNGSFFS